MPLSPHTYSIPHDYWRPHQHETVEWLLDRKLPAVRIVDAPTGSGKSVFGRALASRYKTVVLTHTKSLQEAYRKLYKAAIVFGKSNYRCIHDYRLYKWATVEDCLFGNAYDCIDLERCEYYIRKHIAKGSKFSCLNYAMWMTDFKHWPIIDALVLDEAHLISDLVLEHSGIQITQVLKNRWDLPELPQIIPNRGGSLFDDDTGQSDGAQVIQWLQDAILHLTVEQQKLSEQIAKHPNSEIIRELHICERLCMKLVFVANAVEEGPKEAWYIRNEVDYTGQPAITIKPLTARFQFPRTFLEERKLTMLMSATIGNPEVLARECGIPAFANIVIPNQWPPESRPICVLDAPPMGRSSVKKDPLAFDKQADVIAKAILQYPQNWCGIIHVTRKNEATLLAERLAKRGLQDRIWVPPQENTIQQIEAWERRKQEQPGSLMVGWAFWVGFDGLDERICVVAKCPFPFIGDNYERARMHYDGKLYRQRAAWALEQGLGRTRRGRREDYNVDGINGFVAIADAQWTQLRNYMSQSVLDAIVELPTSGAW